jgi:manganese/zinc/iron transport system substrate-binding protein
MTQMFSRRTLLTAAVALPVLTSRGAAQAPLSVVTTTGMIADTARRIGGPRVLVESLMGPGVDPHAYRPTRSDIGRLARADLILWHGLTLEAQMEPVLADLARTRPVVAVAEALDPAGLLAHDDYPDRFDPHVWMDPMLWADVGAAIARALGAADPAGAEGYILGATDAATQAADLDLYSREVLGSVPEPARVLVTAHDAFNYFGRAYGFEVQGIQGISTESEAGVARIAELVDLLVTRAIPAVFVESSVSDRGLNALIEGAAARGHQVRIGGQLYSDAMGQDGTWEGTWPGMIDHNVTTIARALGGTVPAGGWQGRLAG